MTTPTYNLSYPLLLVVFGDCGLYSVTDSTTYDNIIVSELNFKKNKKGFQVDFRNIPLMVRYRDKPYPTGTEEEITKQTLQEVLSNIPVEVFFKWLQNINSSSFDDGKKCLKDEIRKLLY